MRPVRTVGIVGAGFMGSGIAESVAVSGSEVIVHEPAAGPLEQSRERVGASLAQAVQRGKLGSGEAADARARIAYTRGIGDLASCQLVVEAVTEDEAVKTAVFRRLDAATPAGTILASNTSSIPIAGLAAATSRPERVLGLHFFSPVPVMKVAEVIPSVATAPETLRAAEAFVHQIGKRPIRSKDRAGFLVNMLLIPYLVAAVRLYEEGFATREDIDDGMKLGCGHPMGPLTLCDFIGLDVIHSICACLYEEYHRDEYASPPLLKRMVASGHLGRKTGQGFYDYTASLARVAS